MTILTPDRWQHTLKSAESKPAGMIDHEARTAIQELIQRYGSDRAEWVLSLMLEDEKARAK